MNVSRAYAIAAATVFAVGSLFAAPNASAQTLVWEDNFDGPAIDGNKWIYDVGDGCQLGICGWGNSELQYYTSRPENARIENGRLIIEARRENFGSRAFTSARLKTEGRMHFKYGTLEARIKTPDLRNGLWPAYWMLGTVGNWPASGEIDLLEMGSAAAIAAGVTNRRVGAAVHWDYNGSQADYNRDHNSSFDLNNDFHTYRMTWDPQFIRVSIDGQQYFEFAISDIEGGSLHEFHHPYYLLLNLAVGGSYTGVMSNGAVNAPLPGRMEIDYIRLYQNPGSELYTGANPPSGKFGVFTERADMNNRLSYNGDANLWLWNNLTPFSATPFEGNQLMAYRANAGAWYGLGVALNGYKNMSRFANGRLKFHMRTTTPSTFKIGINTSFGNSWIDFVNGGQQYGLVRDGQWHEVSIPFSAFHDLDLRATKQMFMVVSDPPATGVDVVIDNVYYQDF